MGWPRAPFRPRPRPRIEPIITAAHGPPRSCKSTRPQKVWDPADQIERLRQPARRPMRRPVTRETPLSRHRFDGKVPSSCSTNLRLRRSWAYTLPHRPHFAGSATPNARPAV